MGRGNFASVYQATQKGTTKEVAVKIISKSKFDRRPKMLPSVIQEIGILMSLEAHVRRENMMDKWKECIFFFFFWLEELN